MPSQKGKVAFITGANGITGNALVEHLIRQPASEWSKIVITSRRRPTQVFWQDHRIRFIALDSLRPAQDLVEEMAPLCHDVTHAFFASYVHRADFTELSDYNVPLFANFLAAIDTVAAKTLQRVVLHTGGKYYGVHLGPVEAPIHEDMPRYVDYGQNFYYPQEDLLVELSSKRDWDWNVIRPNAIVGFTPAGNGMSQALTLAIYILCCRELGQPPLFPGNKYFWNSVDDSSSALSLADMSIWAAANEHTKNEDFNHTNGDVFIWKYFWPKLARYFGVEVPEEAYAFKADGEDQRMANSFSMVDWSRDKAPVWEAVVAKHGGNPEAIKWGTWDFFDWCVGKAWITIGTPSKARKFGWTRYDDSLDSWIQTFRSFENAGVLPLQNPPPAADVKMLGLRPNPADVVAAKSAGVQVARENPKGLSGDVEGVSVDEERPVSPLDSEETRIDENGAGVMVDGMEKVTALHVEAVPNDKATTVTI